ncbi:MAG: hypothetical protein WBB45_13255 [Cyclobacteriaceae bacterium]
MEYITGASYQLYMIEAEGSETGSYSDEITNSTASMEMEGGESSSLTLLTDAGHTMSSTASGDSVNYLSAVRFDLPEELSRRYHGWRM